MNEEWGRCVCLRETSIKQHLSAFSFRWLSSSIHIVIAVMSAWSTTKSAGERMVRYNAILSAKSDMVLVDEIRDVTSSM